MIFSESGRDSVQGPCHLPGRDVVLLPGAEAQSGERRS